MTYQEFIEQKKRIHQASGFEPTMPLNETLFEFQKWIVIRALKLGQSAIWADCGLGKSRMQIEWAKHVMIKENKSLMIIAPLIVCHQSVREGAAIGVEVRHVKKQSEVTDTAIYITNFDRADAFDADEFCGVVLDESSILKQSDGKTRTALIQQWKRTKYKLCCTATPAPNDVMELGNHAEFLGVRTASEMLSMYFVHDGGETQKWRIKRHAVKEFWRWVISWSIMLKKPHDIGFECDGYDLPNLNTNELITDCEASDGYLIPLPACTLQERLQAYRNSLPARMEKVKELANNNSHQWLVWCKMNDESEQLTKAIDGAIEITGSMEEEEKAERMLAFADGKNRVLVTKSKIAGMGANFQSCHKMIFAGVTDSFEQYYQSVRRCWRFGQKKEVDVYIIGSSAETAVFQNLRRKEKDADEMALQLNELIKESLNISKTKGITLKYNARHDIIIPQWLNQQSFIV